MSTPELVNYIKKQLQKGATKEEIKNALIDTGWQISDIEEGFKEAFLPDQETEKEPVDSFKDLTGESNTDTENQNQLYQSQLGESQSYRGEIPSFEDMSSSSLSFSSNPVAKKSKILSIIFSLIILLLLIGGGVFAYFYFFQSPERVVKKMISRLDTIKSLRYSGDLKLETYEPNPSDDSSKKLTYSVLIKFNGSSDNQDPQNFKSDNSLDINLIWGTLSETIQTQINFSLDLKMVNKLIYVKLKNLPKSKPFDLTFLEDQWIKIDSEKDLKLTKLEEKVNKELSTTEQAEKIKSIFEESKVFQITEKLPSEKIEGVNVYHYKFIIDKEGLKQFIIETNEALMEKMLSEKEVLELEKTINNAIDLYEGEIWIGKKDLLPHKIFVNLKTKGTEKEKEEAILTFTASFKDFNQPVQLEAPIKTKTLQEVMGEVFSHIFGGSLTTPNLQITPSPLTPSTK